MRGFERRITVGRQWRRQRGRVDGGTGERHDVSLLSLACYPRKTAGQQETDTCASRPASGKLPEVMASDIQSPDSRSSTGLASADPAWQAMWYLLALGIFLRLVVFFSASPFNPDQHFKVIEYIATRHVLPTSNVLDQSYQPPLYYALMAVLYEVTASVRAVHAASLVMSCANLALIRSIFAGAQLRALVPSTVARVLGFACCATLPEFVMFSSFISNDSLSYLLGTTTLWMALRYSRSPSTSGWVWLAISSGIGLLTKGTFLLIGPALAIVAICVERRRSTAIRALTIALTFCVIFAAIGSYKFIENTARLGRPIVHNQDNVNRTSLTQRGVWRGWRSLLDANVVKVVRHPVIQRLDPPSYPMLLYSTFWYSCLPESSFNGNTHGYAWVGSITLAVAVVPTAVFILGLVFTCGRFRNCNEFDDPASRCLAFALAMLLANVAIVLIAGAKYDNVTSFQARMCFPSILPMVLLFGIGLSRLRRFRPAYFAAIGCSWACVGCGLLYFLVEISLAWGVLDRGEAMPWL